MKKLWVVVVGVVVGVGGFSSGRGLAAQQPTSQGRDVGHPKTEEDSSAPLRNDKQGEPVGAKRTMTFADLMAMKRVSDPQISPSGKWVVFTLTDVSLEKNNKLDHLWIVPLDGSAAERHLQTSAENDATAVNSARFSPDGKWLMYSKPMSERLWFAPFHDSDGTVGKEEAVTTFNGAHDAVWAPDSQHILFSMDVYPECESHLPMGQKRDEDELICNLKKDDEESRAQVKALVFNSLLYRHWDSYQGAKRSHIFYLKMRRYDDPPFSAISPNPYSYPTDLTPESVIGDHVAPTFSLGGPLGYAISPDGKEVAYVVNLDKVPAASTNNGIFVLKVGAEPSTAVKVSTSLGSDDGPAYSPDGKWLAWRSQKQAGFESDKFRLVVMDRWTGTIRDVIPKFDRWVDEFVWAPDSGAIYLASGNTGEESLFRVWTSNFEVQQFINEGEYGDLRLSPDGRLLVASRMTADAPAEIDVLDAGVAIKASPEKMGLGATVPTVGEIGLMHLLGETQINRGILASLVLAKLESFWFTGAEETRVEGFMLKPPGFDPAKKYPVKFLMHGGPQSAWGDAWSYRWNWELMAASGYVVIGVNRRGSTGYGQKFVDEVSGDWGGRAYVDLMKGLDYAEAHFPFIDKTRECALGASYGGYMADWVLTHTNRFKCIVTHDGMYDPVSAYGSTEELWFNEWEFRRPEDFPAGWDGFEPTHRDSAAMNGAPGLRGGREAGSSAALRNDTQAGEGHPAEPWRYASLPADEDPFRKWSPMRFIENAKTPTLVIHSQKDYRLDVSQGFELFTALQRLGVPSKMLYFPDEGHWVLKPRNSELWYEEVGDWCDRWTHSGKYAEVGAGR